MLIICFQPVSFFLSTIFQANHFERESDLFHIIGSSALRHSSSPRKFSAMKPVVLKFSQKIISVERKKGIPSRNFAIYAFDFYRRVKIKNIVKTKESFSKSNALTRKNSTQFSHFQHLT